MTTAYLDYEALRTLTICTSGQNSLGNDTQTYYAFMIGIAILFLFTVLTYFLIIWTKVRVIRNRDIPNAQWFTNLSQALFFLLILLVYVYYIIAMHYTPIISIDISPNCWLNGTTSPTLMDLLLRSTVSVYILIALVTLDGITFFIEIGWRIFLALRTVMKDDMMEDLEFSI